MRILLGYSVRAAVSSIPTNGWLERHAVLELRRGLEQIKFSCKGTTLKQMNCQAARFLGRKASSRVARLIRFTFTSLTSLSSVDRNDLFLVRFPKARRMDSQGKSQPTLQNCKIICRFMAFIVVTEDGCDFQTQRSRCSRLSHESSGCDLLRPLRLM